MRNTVDVTGGKPIAVLLKSLSGVSRLLWTKESGAILWFWPGHHTRQYYNRRYIAFLQELFSMHFTFHLLIKGFVHTQCTNVDMDLVYNTFFISANLLLGFCFPNERCSVLRFPNLAAFRNLQIRRDFVGRNFSRSVIHCGWSSFQNHFSLSIIGSSCSRYNASCNIGHFSTLVY
jgi:hypothetical protein